MHIKGSHHLSVVGIGFPKERNTETIRPNFEIAESFDSKKNYFADSFLKCSEVMNFFSCKIHAGERASTYEFRTNARKAYFNGLKKLRDKNVEILDYSANVKQVLSLENQLLESSSLDEANFLKEIILFTQTFERARKVLEMIDLAVPTVIYADLSLAYAIHLMTGCEIVLDCFDQKEQKQTAEGFETMRNGLSFFYLFKTGKLKTEQSTLGKTRLFTHKVFQNQGISHEERGIRYFSNTETFFLMNGHPQNGFCPFELSEYKVFEHR